MTRTAACTALLLWTVALFAADKPREVTIRWHGQSFFQIESSRGTRVVIDPHQIDAYGRKSVAADLVLCSHLHNDHTQLGAIANRDKAKVIPGLVPNERTKRPEWNPTDTTFRDIHVRTVATYHDDSKGMEHGKNTVFVLEIDGLHIVHLGDLGHALSDADVKKIGPVDVLMIPVGGVYTINGAQAKQVVGQLKPRQYVLPMHYGTRVFQDLLPADEFLEDQKHVKRLPGNKLTAEAGASFAEPVVVVLNWQ